MTTQAFNLSQFGNYLNSSGQVSASGIQSGVVLPSGTISLYYQASAPTGWTQITSLNDYDLRLVSSGGGTTGGTTAYSSVFVNQTPTISGGSISATTLSTAQIPAHSHSTTFYQNNACGSFATSNQGAALGPYSVSTDSQGGGGSHTHSISSLSSSSVTLNVRYANIILCSKN